MLSLRLSSGGEGEDDVPNKVRDDEGIDGLSGMLSNGVRGAKVVVSLWMNRD